MFLDKPPDVGASNLHMWSCFSPTLTHRWIEEDELENSPAGSGRGRVRMLVAYLGKELVNGWGKALKFFETLVFSLLGSI